MRASSVSGLTALYPWLKALHVIAVIAWMVGLLYLPRLYVYHTGSPPGSECAAMLETMERRLLRGIMVPALAMTYLFGLLLAATPGAVDWQRGWIWAKLVFVLVLTAFHLFLVHCRHDLAAGKYSHTAKFYRIANELPTLLMIAIVVLVLVKPF